MRLCRFSAKRVSANQAKGTCARVKNIFVCKQIPANREFRFQVVVVIVIVVVVVAMGAECFEQFSCMGLMGKSPPFSENHALICKWSRTLFYVIIYVPHSRACTECTIHSRFYYTERQNIHPFGVGFLASTNAYKREVNNTQRAQILNLETRVRRNA